VLERVGLHERGQRKAAELTIPDLKRLELAKALAMDPQLLFLDEVMAGLNPVEVERATELIQSINQSGITIFVIEHAMKAIMGISLGLAPLVVDNLLNLIDTDQSPGHHSAAGRAGCAGGAGARRSGVCAGGRANRQNRAGSRAQRRPGHQAGLPGIVIPQMMRDACQHLHALRDSLT
jgi:hypothetical protein